MRRDGSAGLSDMDILGAKRSVLYSAQILKAEKQSNFRNRWKTGLKALRVIRCKDSLTVKFTKHRLRWEVVLGLWTLLHSCLQKCPSANTAGRVRIKKSNKIKFTLSLRGRGELQITAYGFPAGCRGKCSSNQQARLTGTFPVRIIVDDCFLPQVINVSSNNTTQVNRNQQRFNASTSHADTEGKVVRRVRFLPAPPRGGELWNPSSRATCGV